MTKKELLAHINQKALIYASFTLEELDLLLLELDNLLKEYLDQNPHDLDIWLKFIRVEFQPGFLEYDIIIEYFEKALTVQQLPILYVLKAYAEYVTRYIYPETYAQLCQAKGTTNDEKAMLAYMKALAVQELVGTQPPGYELYLLESIEYGPSFFWNHVKLGQYYVGIGKREKGCALLAQGIKNVLHIYSDDDFYDPTDINEFINERIKGIHLTEPNFNHILEYFTALENTHMDIKAN